MAFWTWQSFLSSLETTKKHGKIKLFHLDNFKINLRKRSIFVDEKSRMQLDPAMEVVDIFRTTWETSCEIKEDVEECFIWCQQNIRLILCEKNFN